MAAAENGVTHLGGHSCCKNADGTTSGPGYPTPLVRKLLYLCINASNCTFPLVTMTANTEFPVMQDAFNSGDRETLLYVPAIVPDQSRPDYLAVVDVDPQSDTYQQVIHRTHMPNKGDELHHTGWNACSSCFGDAGYGRKYLILPGFASGRIHALDVQKNPQAPSLAHIVEAKQILNATGLSWPHTAHCLGTGEMVVSMLGDENSDGKGGFLVLDQEFKIKGTWTDKTTAYGYDFWYQPRFDVVISSEFGSPNAFKQGFDPSLVGDKYGSRLHVWSWKTREHQQVIDLGPDGLIPLEIRFLHNPDKPLGFLGAALSSNIHHIHKTADGKEWTTTVVVRQPWTKVSGWALPEQPPLITDILVSLDDKYLYFSNWIRGDINQYDISDPENPKHVGRVWVGGSIQKGSGVEVTEGEFKDAQPEIPTVKGVTLQGGPQMIQLSLDGKRLYVTNSLFSPWDRQFYPDMLKQGSQLLRINVDTENGGLSIDDEFIIDFGKEPDGPVLAHEVRFPGGDCSSDIWV